MMTGTSYRLNNLLNRKIFYPRHLGLGSLVQRGYRTPGQKYHWKERTVSLYQKTFTANPCESLQRSWLWKPAPHSPPPSTYTDTPQAHVLSESLELSAFPDTGCPPGERQCSSVQVKMLRRARSLVGSSTSQPTNKHQDWQQHNALTVPRGSNFSIQRGPQVLVYWASRILSLQTLLVSNQKQCFTV